MVGVFSHAGRCRQDNDRSCSTVTFLGFLVAVIKQFLSKEQLLRNRRKQSVPYKIFVGLSFRQLQMLHFLHFKYSLDILHRQIIWNLMKKSTFSAIQEGVDRTIAETA